jgi:hypothetical protein
MNPDHSEEQLNCAIEASSYVLKTLDHNTGLSEEKITEALSHSKVCGQLPQQELDVVVAYICGLAHNHINYRNRTERY